MLINIYNHVLVNTHTYMPIQGAGKASRSIKATISHILSPLRPMPMLESSESWAYKNASLYAQVLFTYLCIRIYIHIYMHAYIFKHAYTHIDVYDCCYGEWTRYLCNGRV